MLSVHFKATILLVTVYAIIPSSAQFRSRYTTSSDSECSKRCPRSSKCISGFNLCNGYYDCESQSDETFCDATKSISCPANEFQCSRGLCVPKSSFCDGLNSCGDYSDEFYCEFPINWSCPTNWIQCKDASRCIPSYFKCDGSKDCVDGWDERDCGDPAFPPPIRRSILKVTENRSKGVKWLLSRRKSVSSTDRWGPNLHRIAIALFLSDESVFATGNKTGEEMGYELSIQLLHKLSGNRTMRDQELALYLQAMLVTCSDPRDFFGRNLVSELRQRVDASNYTNPFEILALCNAKDNMTNKDLERVITSFDSQHRPFWTDTQAIATMALQCLSSTPNVRVDERTVKDMQDELKKRQFRNGSVDNAITTALVAQALMGNGSYNEFFDMVSAISVLMQNQRIDGSWGSIRNTYYVLPVLSFKSLLNISSKHCTKRMESEEESLQKLQDATGDKFVVQYSVWIGDDVDLGRTWRVRVKSSKDNSFYDIIEMVKKLDSKHNVTYNVIENKPYVSALYGKEDDPEMGLYWFTYVRSLKNQEAPKLIESSPVDVKVLPNQELILWYKPGKWSTSGNSKKEEA